MKFSSKRVKILGGHSEWSKNDILNHPNGVWTTSVSELCFMLSSISTNGRMGEYYGRNVSSDVRVHWQARDCGLLFKQAIYGPKENRKIDCTCVPAVGCRLGTVRIHRKCRMSHSLCMANFKTSKPFPTKCDMKSHAAKQNILNGITSMLELFGRTRNTIKITIEISASLQIQSSTESFPPTVRNDSVPSDTIIGAPCAMLSTVSHLELVETAANIHRKIQMLYLDNIMDCAFNFWRTSTSIDCSFRNNTTHLEEPTGYPLSLDWTPN